MIMESEFQVYFSCMRYFVAGSSDIDAEHGDEEEDQEEDGLLGRHQGGVGQVVAFEEENAGAGEEGEELVVPFGDEEEVHGEGGQRKGAFHLNFRMLLLSINQYSK